MLSQIQEFVNYIRRRNMAARTWRDYSYDLQQFADLVGDRAPGTISFHDIDTFIKLQASKGFKPTTINRRLNAIVSFYTFLSDDDPNLVCPVLSHRHYLREPQRLPRPIRDEALSKFFSVIDVNLPHGFRDRAMFLLMLRCGLRIAEVAHLLISDLYLDEYYPRLVACGKGSQERSVYLSSQAYQALQVYLAVRPTAPCDFVFLSYQNQGMSTTAIHKRLMHYRELAGVSISAHGLRHSFASNLVNADVPVTTIQKLMGHRWLETTQTYILANDHQVAADYYAACQKLEGWQ